MSVGVNVDVTTSYPSNAPRCVLITGATGAIGGALARAYAAPATHLVLHGRNQQTLEGLAMACREKGAQVSLSSASLTDQSELNDWLDALCAEHVPDIVIANAGINTHPSASTLEPWDEVQALLDVNLKAPIAMAQRLVPAMQARGSGQLVFISSLAGWHGLPTTPSYSASKAGIKAYGEGLRGLLEPHGIGVTVVMPGYVTSAMCNAMPGPKPWEWPPERAANAIQRGITANRARISFPFPLNFGTWWLAVLPAGISQWLIKRLGFNHTGARSVAFFLSSTFISPLLVGLLGSVLFEALLSPRPQPFWKRGIAANTLHLGSWLLLFGAFMLLLQRPWFAVVFILSLQLVVVQSSNTKSRTLNEPFICHDFEYFWDAILHPRLYVPFFGIGLAIAASSAGTVAIGSFLVFEPSLVRQWGGTAFLVNSLVLIAIGTLLVWLGWRKLPPITLTPTIDLNRLGLFSSLWAYGIALMHSQPPTPDASPFQPLSQHNLELDADAVKPNVVLVQSESFFDPRPWCSEIAADLLPNYDATCQEAIVQGALNVPAWGANTVRTECAVLTGIAPDAWGARQFNPYRTLSRHTLPSIASAFKAQGYRTVCVHPYPATFYMRDSVIPKLGFETFIDISAFESQDKHGQYTGDQAVARRVGRLLEDNDNRPLFVFVITMENHGPLHLEAPEKASVASTLPAAPWPLPPHLRDLAVYLHHLGESDKMLGSVKAALNSAIRPGLLGWYGDHVPILPAAYRHYSPPASSTPYMIWSTEVDRNLHDKTPIERTSCTLEANELGVYLFKRAFGRDISSDVIKAEPEPQEQE